MSSLGFSLLRPVAVTDAVLASSTVAETDYAPWDAGTAYVVGDRAIRTGVHKVFERVVAGTTATAPEDDPVNWLDAGSTLRWKMFDRSIATQTTAADSLTVELTPGVPCTALYLGNVAGATVQLQEDDPVDGIVFDQTVDMISDSGIVDWYAWFFEPIERKSDALFTGLPPYAGATLRIIVSDAGATVAVGVCLIGLLREIGGTKRGVSLGIKDYSQKEADQWGGYSPREGEFSKRGRFNVELPNSMIDVVHRLLSQYRATPILYIGSDQYDSMLVYGFYKDFDIVIPGPVYSDCALQIEGLT